MEVRNQPFKLPLVLFAKIVNLLSIKQQLRLCLVCKLFNHTLGTHPYFNLNEQIKAAKILINPSVEKIKTYLQLDPCIDKASIWFDAQANITVIRTELERLSKVQIGIKNYYFLSENCSCLIQYSDLEARMRKKEELGKPDLKIKIFPTKKPLPTNNAQFEPFTLREQIIQCIAQHLSLKVKTTTQYCELDHFKEVFNSYTVVKYIQGVLFEKTYLSIVCTFPKIPISAINKN